MIASDSVKVSIHLLELGELDKNAACVVILMENCVSYPGLVMLSAREIAFNVVDMPTRILALLKKSANTIKLLGSRIKLAQVLNVLGIRYLIAVCISDSV